MIAQLALSVSLFLFLTLERFINALAVLFMGLVLGHDPGDGGVSEMKTYASVQMLGSGVSLFTTMYSSVVQALVSVAQVLVSYVVFASVATFAFSILYVVQEYYPEILLELVDYWNSFAGPYIQTLFVSPLQILNTVFTAVTPAYNYFLWIVQQFFYNAVITTAARDLGPVQQLGFSTAQLVKHVFLVYIFIHIIQMHNWAICKLF